MHMMPFSLPISNARVQGCILKILSWRRNMYFLADFVGLFACLIS